MRQVTHQAGTYPGFFSIKRPGVFLLSQDGMLLHCKYTPSIKFAGTHLYTWVERGNVRVNCLAQAKTQHDVSGQDSNPDHLTALDCEATMPLTFADHDCTCT